MAVQLQGDLQTQVSAKDDPSIPKRFAWAVRIQTRDGAEEKVSQWELKLTKRYDFGKLQTSDNTV
jgi:hypothetical protein